MIIGGSTYRTKPDACTACEESVLSWESILYGMIASLVIVIPYGLLVAQREERIRGYLSVKRRGWVRRRYVKALVRALRGHAAALDRTMLMILALMIPFLAASYSWSSARDIQSRVADIDYRLAAAAKDLSSNHAPTRESLEGQLRTLQTRQEAARRAAGRFEFWAKAFSLLLYGLVLFGLVFWLPLAALSRQFECELDRFSLRIQGLASKGELAELAIAESEVVDEESLRAFFRLAASIATRQGVPRLVERFDLWADA